MAKSKTDNSTLKNIVLTEQDIDIKSVDKYGYYEYLKLAEKGDVFAMILLGVICSQTYNIYRFDPMQAEMWLKKSIKKHEYDRAVYELANLHYNEHIKDASLKKAYEYYKKLVGNNYLPAISKLADCFYYGKGIKQNKKRAYALYLQAALQNDAYSQYKIFDMFNNGEVKEISKTEALHMLISAAEAGHNNAIYYLADFYYRGKYFAQDYKKAYNLFLKIANVVIVGDVTPEFQMQALINLGDMYSYGLGVEKDLDTAQIFYYNVKRVVTRKMYNHLVQYANYKFADAYVDKHTAKDIAKGIDLLEKYYKAFGNIHAGIAYACYLDDGVVVQQNQQQAIQIYQNILSFSNNTVVMFKLGTHYLFGSVIPKNYEKAFEYFKYITQHPEGISNTYLGRAYFFVSYMYFHGYHVKKDLKLYRQYQDKAVELNCGQACYYKGLDLLNGSNGYARSQKQGFNLVLNAAEQGIPNAMDIVAKLYRDGVGTTANLTKAKQWEQKAKQHK